MTFNKKSYWKRREEGKRGQEDFDPVVSFDRNFGSNRKSYRRKVKDRDYTRPNYEYITEKRTDSEGKPDRFKGHIRKKPKYTLPDDIDHDPRLSNHDKMIIRKQERLARQRRERERANGVQH